MRGSGGGTEGGDGGWKAGHDVGEDGEISRVRIHGGEIGDTGDDVGGGDGGGFCYGMIMTEQRAYIET